MCYRLWFLTSLAVIPALVFAKLTTHFIPVTVHRTFLGEQWTSALNCSRCADVSSGDASIAATVYIVDEFLECETEDLGLSPTVLQRLNGDSPGNNIAWQFIAWQH
ncbi:unnamed protein product [Peronospora destructor]|uniref:Uncharacterized protein n=1 Tax=Peronospora destructor TaxID=86335 RepID=A0AAV0TZ21_9STRA|nr:unnamed protein product [Peronospora destructor]